ncbi:YecA family protein [Acetobacterium bakii]|uniref:YecA family protein n=1 Tax=Acetobacterium bakii TaxID=52689 RepID=UPI000680235B|nr:SEC-C metal-binding domain-containing protein [Acetobacterium bakii]
MKLGRNSPCPCGSGKKHKKCCLGKSKQELVFENILKNQSTVKKESRIKQCLHPNKSECTSKIIHAHAIQNNRILNKIAVNGLVQTMDGVSNLFFQSAQSKGRKIATVFTGFCQYHDKVLFQDIEDREFLCETKQLFLFTYRTFAWHYHKKQEQINNERITQKNIMDILNDNSYMRELSPYNKALYLAQRDNDIKKKMFDNCLLTEDYNKIKSSVWEIPYGLQFAVSAMLEIEFDLEGRKINDIHSKNCISSIYLNIFPNDEKSFCVWSWQSEDDKPYCDYVKQFMNLPIKERENYLNNKLPRWSDAIIISPRLWEKWGADIQQSLIAHANFEALYRAMEEENGSSYSYSDTPWDFFENL